MKAWVPKEVVLEHVRSRGLSGWIDSTYNKAVPCSIQLSKISNVEGMVEIEIAREGWSPCRFLVPIDKVSVEVHMKGTSLPLVEAMRLRRYLAFTYP